MEFGKVSDAGNINFSMPDDDPSTDALFSRLIPDDQPVKIYVGGTNWGTKGWVGRVYPRKTKEKDFLAHYTRQFNTIELNALFYNVQPREVIERWASVADEQFRFCPKFSNTISHTLQLENAQRDTDLFIRQVEHFGKRLGPSFLQLSDRYGPDRSAGLQHYLRQIPAGFRFCLELRHEDWFRRGGMPGAGAVQDTWELLRSLGIGAVITDTSGRRDVLHMRLTAPLAFIRFVGNNLHPTDFTRIDAWAVRLKSWIGKGLREIYFFIHSHDELHSPELAHYAVERFNQVWGAGLRLPQLVNGGEPENLSLF